MKQNQSTNTSIKQLSRLALISILLLISAAFSQSTFAANNLSSVKKELSQQKNKNSHQQAQQKKLEKQVKKAEIETAKISLKESQTKKAIQTETASLKQLKRETAQLEIDKEKQQKLLEQQLISAYMAGQHDLIKLILNQEDLSKITRAKSYYFYLNQARLASIENLQKTHLQLESNLASQQQSLANLNKMHAEQKETKIALSKQNKSRSKALKKLNKDLSYNTSRIAQLTTSQANLTKQLKQAQAARQERELAAAKAASKKKISIKPKDKTYSSIAKSKGKLRWPIRGKVLATFGSQRSKHVKWNGIAIAANEGEKVRAVSSGRVLFAGYFKGYGMVIALDHSDNYITLYGYNQTLLHKKGDVVFAGDAIALAGHSGGQDKNSLYFELSHKGKAQNPLKWLKKRKR